MNECHSDVYGSINIEDYILKINDFINKYKNINNIFIASDNNESLIKIKKYYEDYNIKISFINDIVRINKEIIDFESNTNFIIENMDSETDFHTNIFIEMLVLSKCSYFIHRVSDFANFAIIYSDTFKVIENISPIVN